MLAWRKINEVYRRRRSEIRRRLKEFDRFAVASADEVFEELCFCLLTPQSKARACMEIMADLKKNGLLRRGKDADLWPFLRRTRFYRKKTEYLLAARRLFFGRGGARVVQKVLKDKPYALRHWIVENIRGLGYKEASHFLRNIGRGRDLAILDIHILRGLKKCGLLDEIPRALGRKNYLEIEEKLRGLATRTGIPLAHLDFVLWSMGTGTILK